mmetsp:Transcript_41475/g.117455  ORF Transcript_41475/g.117455 Transcript_41475/m.117455 type:complete len:460 (+) Transcript_41475:292-1671(+)
MVAEEVTIRTVEHQHVVLPVAASARELLREIQAVALFVDDASQGELLHVLLQQRSQECIRVPRRLAIGEGETEVHRHRRVHSARDDLNELPCELPPEPLHLQLRVEARVRAPHVPDEGAHAEGEEDELLYAQAPHNLGYIAHDVPHGLQVRLHQQARRAVLVLPAEVFEVRGPAQLADVDGGGVRDQECGSVAAFVELPVPIHVRDHLRHDDVVAPQQELRAGRRRALLGLRRPVDPSMQPIADLLHLVGVRRHDGVPEPAQAQLRGHLPHRVLPAARPLRLALGPHGLPPPTPLPSEAVDEVVAEENARVLQVPPLLLRQLAGFGGGGGDERRGEAGGPLEHRQVLPVAAVQGRLLGLAVVELLLEPLKGVLQLAPGHGLDSFDRLPRLTWSGAQLLQDLLLHLHPRVELVHPPTQLLGVRGVRCPPGAAAPRMGRVAAPHAPARNAPAAYGVAAAGC